MASEKDKRPEEMTFKDMIKRLETLSKPVINDRRQNKYCEYITRLLSHFGREKCLVAGSTQENMRLRIREDEGDFDYLIISEISIPSASLEYREDLPCFVHINGLSLKHVFPDVEFINEKYLPSNLLSEVRPEVFRHIRDIYKIVCKPGSRRGRHTLHVFLDHRIKPGTSLVNYANAQCPELGIQKDKPKKDSKEIIKQLQKRLDKESSPDKKRTVSTLETVTNLTRKFKTLSGDTNEPEPNILQTYGSVITALDENSEFLKASVNREKQKTPLSDQHKYTRQDKNADACGEIDQDTKSTIQESDSKDTVAGDSVLIKYTYKTSKDFIPAFPLSGRPKYLDLWTNRKRKSGWPSEDTIEKIYNSEFFIVSKPALTNENKQIDFCLAYNMAEKELAKEMTEVQKKVMLIIKAIRKDALNEYSQILTTFHWKTAIYWKSESVDRSVLIDTEDNILTFLHSVLQYMTDCLCHQNLQHYLIPSNLFAGIEEDKLFEIASKILEIQENPVEALRTFFIRQRDHQWRQEMVPRNKVQEFNKMYNDPSESSTVDDIFCLLRRFLNEDTKKFKEALRDVLTEAMPFIIEEEMRGRKKTRTTTLIEFLLSSACVRNMLINIFILYIEHDKDFFVKTLTLTAGCLIAYILLARFFSLSSLLLTLLIALIVFKMFRFNRD